MSDLEFDQRLYLEKTGYLLDHIKAMSPGAQRAVLLALAEEMHAQSEILPGYQSLIDFKIEEEYPDFPLTEPAPQFPLTPEEMRQSHEIIQAIPELFTGEMTPEMKIYFLCEVLSHLRVAIRPEGFRDDFDELHWLLYFGMYSKIFAP